ncbi:K+ transport system, NAD-binding component [Synechococcus sp. PCC 7502]|uniref:potassium channel family protein n=1 Tax=Synechococcus sp. PCC 7502 TaxID=1173263 RepID=UPI00029FE9AD|nr:NAD-binding protein [Synechococcus sp. PCC 7502]AFY74506.1 K+ transport system, NAD-binding component [Synechococcus sp. PCC 7502]
MKPLIIVCGLNRVGYKILRLLRQQEALVVGISDRPIADDQGSNIIIGELHAASTLIEAGIQSAHTLVLSNSDEAQNLTILMQARVLNPQIRVVNRLFNSNLGDRLDRTLVDHVSMSVSALSAPVFAFTALGHEAIGQLRLFNQTWSIHEEYIDENHAWLGTKLSRLWEDRTRMLVYYLPADCENRHTDLVSAVTMGKELNVGDRLLIGTQPTMRSGQKSIKQRLAKLFSNFRHFQQHSRAVLLVAFALVLTILGATLTYTSFRYNISLIDSLYFSVGMITGAGGNSQIAEQAPDGIKVFTVIMMLVGTAVIGIWYALLNDFVLGTRFKQFINASRVPQQNHYIICGLGGVGTQTALLLMGYGHDVVVIERDPSSRFLNMANSLGIPVVQGDASIPATLKAAYLEKAEAIIAVTSNDTANLEIALNAKGMAPKVPAIVRYEDPKFAAMVRQVFDFEFVLSPSEIVAPSFAAAALGGKILGNGILGDTLWIALATLITPHHPFCGKLVKDAAMIADFVPLYIETNIETKNIKTGSQTIHGWDLLEFCLSNHDVLYLTIPANKLEYLWKSKVSKSSQAIAN